MTKAEFVARVMADKAAEAERKRRAIWRGRWEAAIAKGEHIEQMRRRKRGTLSGLSYGYICWAARPYCCRLLITSAARKLKKPSNLGKSAPTRRKSKLIAS